MGVSGGIQIPTFPTQLTAGASTFDRRHAEGAYTTASGRIALTYFQAPRSETIGNVAVSTAGTAAAATPTLCRIGVYSVAANGDLTLVGSCASDTTLFAAVNTRYLKALTATYNAIGGQWYAHAVIVVSGVAMPTLQSNNTMGGTGLSSGLDPRIQGQLNGQTDLVATIPNASVLNAGSAVYGEVLP